MPPTKSPPPPLPAWLDPDFDDRTAPLRARLVHIPELFGNARDAALNAPRSTATISETYSVLEEPEREAARVRLLCATARDRVALFVKRTDLALVTRKAAVLAAKESELDGALATPGAFASLLFNAGVDVGVGRDVTSAVIPVKYKNGKVSVSGVMSRAQLDEVYEWPASVDSIRRNAKIPRDAVLYDGLRGKAFGRLETLGLEQFYEVETQGAARQGQQLVKVQVSDGVITAWVDEAKVKRAPRGRVPRVTMGRTTSIAGKNAIPLPKGTLFLHGDEPIGVVTSDGLYECVAECGGRTPTVSVGACRSVVALVAQLPPSIH